MTTTFQFDTSKVTAYLSETFGDNLISCSLLSKNQVSCVVKKEILCEVAEMLIKDPLNASFISLVASDERNINGNFKVYTIFSLTAGILLFIEINISENDPTYPALSTRLKSANWSEREAHDLYGLVPIGIELDPLVLHRDWPRGKHFPMRKDFSIDKPIPISEVSHQFKQPHGEGMHQIAVGPIHAGIIEPGHLRFSVKGEEIFHFDAQLFYTHKGIEKMAEGKNIDDVLTLAEHVCGMCSFSHSVAYALAVENLSNSTLPARANFIRTICLELERLSSHMADLISICSAGGFGFGAAFAGRLRENLLRLTQHITGHRYFRGLNAIGGLKSNISNESFQFLQYELEKFKKEFNEFKRLILGSDSFLDRLEITGFLSNESAALLGIVGPSARGSSINKDVRRDLPYLVYSNYKLSIPVYDEGDVLARTKVRIDEILESVKLIRYLIHDLPDGSIYEKINNFVCLVPQASVIESAKGELLHFILLAKDMKVYRWHVRSASYMNWRGMVQATMGNNIVPDGPLVNKSFNLCYACVDR